MTEAIGKLELDANLGLIIEDLRTLRHERQQVVGIPAAKEFAQVAAGYLVVNRPSLDRAFEAWEATPETRLEQMFHSVGPPLDYTASRHDFGPIARHLVTLAPEVVRLGVENNLLDASDDNLHMLLRLLEYAQYLADCSSETVRWHPIERVLGSDHGLLVDLRAELLAG